MKTTGGGGGGGGRHGGRVASHFVVAPVASAENLTRGEWSGAGGFGLGWKPRGKKKPRRGGTRSEGARFPRGGGGTVGPGRLSAVRGPAGSRQASARFLQMGPCLCLHSTHTLLTFPPDPRWVANPIRQFVRPLSAKSVLDTAAWISEAWGGCHAGPAAFTAVSAVTCPAKRCLVVLTVLESHTSHNHTAGAGRWVAVHGAGGGGPSQRCHVARPGWLGGGVVVSADAVAPAAYPPRTGGEEDIARGSPHGCRVDTITVCPPVNRQKKNHGAASLPTRERGDVRKSCLSTHYSRW